MTTSRRAPAAALLAGLLCLLGPLAGFAEDASPWTEGFHSRVRLLAGGADEGGRTRLAAIAIELDDGFKTYWRHPGESGLPPTFSWEGSENLLSAEVLWPVPTRFEDAGGVVNGYKNRALLPVRVAPADPARPVRLALKLDFGVCREICIPASAALMLEVGPEKGAYRAAIAEAVARVPKPMPLGATGDLSITGVTAQTTDGRPTIAVAVRSPSDATLFVEGPESWYLAAGPFQRDAQGGADGRFLLEILERPRRATDAPLRLRLTLVAGDRAIETDASLDTESLPR